MSLRSPNAHGQVTRAIVWKFTGKRPDPNSGEHGLCAPAEPQCTWTFHKSHVAWKFTGKCRTGIRPPQLDTRPFTLTVRPPQCGHTVWGIILSKSSIDGDKCAK